MAELLTPKDKKQISQWIGRNSQFDLLFKLSRDGVSPQRFHELCDNKGPTVTIFYNKDNNVYGGYLSDSWGSTGRWSTDQRSFLFKLYSAGIWKPMQFPYKMGENYFKENGFGPWFYSLPSFYSSTKAYKLSGSYYELNTEYFFNGQKCDMKGETAQSVANGHNNVKDLEVYLVKECKDKGLDCPWRDSPEWSSQTFQELKEFVANYKPFVEMKIPEVNILLVGPVAAGKSSFINTINTIFKGEMSSRICPGCAENSLTQKFCKFRVRDPTTKKHLCFRICDNRGVKDSFFIKSEDISFLLDGYLPNNYTFQLDSGASTKEIGFVKEPTVKEKMHVVVFVLGGRSLDVLSEGVVSKLREIKRMVVDRNIPHLMFLTKTDEICELVEKDVSKMFTNSLVEDAVKKAADIIAIPRSHVLPVKHYEEETIFNMDKNILALMALQKSLIFADDSLENLYDWQLDNIQTLKTKGTERLRICACFYMC